MSNSASESDSYEQEILTLKKEVDILRTKNADLEDRLIAHSQINTGQISLINKLIDKVPFGLMLLDENHTIVHVNVAAEEIFSTDAAQLIGQDSHNYFKNYQRLDNDFISHATEQIILPNSEGAGVDKYVMHSAFESDEGSEKIFVETFIDISEIKKAEVQLQQTNRTKDEFLGMISHELRTPLNVIQGYSSLIEDEVKDLDNPEVLEFLNNIRLSSDLLLKIVSNLLELSELNAGKVKADFMEIDPEMMHSQLQYRLEKVFQEEGNTLVIEPLTIPVFQQDLILLMKVFYEILTNANKFTQAGEIKFSVEMLKTDDNDYLCFQISDTGCGMTDETMQRVFNAFHQADSSLTRTYEGLGLGLSIVEKIMKVIGGQVEIESEFNKGSTFSILIPYIPAS